MSWQANSQTLFPHVAKEEKWFYPDRRSNRCSPCYQGTTTSLISAASILHKPSTHIFFVSMIFSSFVWFLYHETLSKMSHFLHDADIMLSKLCNGYEITQILASYRVLHLLQLRSSHAPSSSLPLCCSAGFCRLIISLAAACSLLTAGELFSSSSFIRLLPAYRQPREGKRRGAF